MDIYDDLNGIMGELEADVAIIETVILNGRNEKANIYLGEAMIAINRALASMSDAVFEITTSPTYFDD